ncbi:hypothetical protein MES5069_220189 [Mesorhizobium escarrei]|uniref:Uncharacterized protein n=1 Tax=Mesorhizobium escarrei TaxID=666018 RepID=A0ABM9DS25_9HYPH|nr:hypothetical protein MES5069_220189 [Mesorhizobium escarrei]
MELRAVIGDDARRLLAPVLQGMQAEGDDSGRILRPKYSEYAAFIMKMIVGLRREKLSVTNIGQDHYRKHKIR